MATGSIEKRGENTYRLIISAGYNEIGRRIKKTKTVKCSEKEAEKELARFLVDVENQQNSTSGKMTVEDLYDYWKKNYADTHLAATTRATYEFIFPRIKAALGKKRIDKIEPKHIQALMAHLAEPGIRKSSKNNDLSKTSLSPSSIKKHFELLSCIFSKAVRWGLLPANPCSRVEPPKLVRSQKELYDQKTLLKFLQKIETEDIKCRLWVLLAFTGGLRREEIFGLEWKHVNFEKCTLRIAQASVYTVATGTILKNTKNKSSNRIISIPNSVITLLKLHKSEQSKTRLKLGDKWQESGRVFTQWNGVPAHPHSFNTWIRKFCSKNNFPHISPHIFRHMSATYLITNGTDIRTVSGKLGHSRTSVTLDIYSHLVGNAEQETANTMESFLSTVTEKKSVSLKSNAISITDSVNPKRKTAQK